MKFTNKYNLPEIVVKALMKDDYHKNTKYSITQILNPDRVTMLTQRHEDEIEVDVSSRSWSVLGTAVHKLFEEAADKDAMTELRFKSRYGYEDFSAQIDHYKNGVITDYKLTSAWTAVFKSKYHEYQKQLSVQALLMRSWGFEVNKIQNLMVLRDHNEKELLKRKGYPKTPFALVEHEILEEIDGMHIHDWVVYRCKKLDSLENVKDNDLPFCTLDERWASDAVFKIYKNKNKTSSKNCSSLKEAQYHARNLRSKYPGAKFRIEEFRAESFRRCEKYCDAAAFCNQYRKYQNSKKVEECKIILNSLAG